MLLATSPNLVGRDCQKHKRRYHRAYGNLIACIWKTLEVLYINFNHLETTPIWEKDLFSLKTLLYINLLNMLRRKPQGASQYIFKTIQKWKKVRNTTICFSIYLCTKNGTVPVWTKYYYVRLWWCVYVLLFVGPSSESFARSSFLMTQ